MIDIRDAGREPFRGHPVLYITEGAYSVLTEKTEGTLTRSVLTQVLTHAVDLAGDDEPKGWNFQYDWGLQPVWIERGGGVIDQDTGAVVEGEHGWTILLPNER